MAWELWRQDEHGNEMLIRVFDDPADAEHARDQLAARGHHQHYWLQARRTDATDHDEATPTADGDPT